MTVGKDWQTSLQQHNAATLSVTATARAIPQARWEEAGAPGKWSPAEITEHLRLTYVALRRELATGEGMRIRPSWLARLVLRHIVLPKVLRTGRLPANAPAVREIRPGAGPFDQAGTTQRLAEEAAAFELDLIANPAAKITHPFFGKADAVTALRFCTIHLLHHERQLTRAAPSAT